MLSCWSQKAKLRKTLVQDQWEQYSHKTEIKILRTKYDLYTVVYTQYVNEIATSAHILLVKINICTQVVLKPFSANSCFNHFSFVCPFILFLCACAALNL